MHLPLVWRYRCNQNVRSDIHVFTILGSQGTMKRLSQLSHSSSEHWTLCSAISACTKVLMYRRWDLYTWRWSMHSTELGSRDCEPSLPLVFRRWIFLGSGKSEPSEDDDFLGWVIWFGISKLWLDCVKSTMLLWAGACSDTSAVICAVVCCDSVVCFYHVEDLFFWYLRHANFIAAPLFGVVYKLSCTIASIDSVGRLVLF